MASMWSRRWLSACALLMLRLAVANDDMWGTMESCAAVNGASGLAFTGCLEERLGSAVLEDHPELVRNYSCSQDDLGSPVLKSLNVTVPTHYDACEAQSAVSSGANMAETGHLPDFVYNPGSFLPAGNDLSGRQATAEEASKVCLSNPACEGFTFQAESPNSRAYVYFKSSAGGRARAKGWHTYTRVRQPTCSLAPLQAETRTYKVDVMREEPLVALVRDFAAAGECDLLVSAGGDWESMGRAHTSEGGHSSYRRSYSSNIYPPLQETDHGLTKFVSRMFAVTRNLTGYNVYPPGQEPVNAVLYKNLGDEYRPHCDGDCKNQAPQRRGERIATSIIYCQAAELGGHTSFSEGAHKVVPVEGDMLLFAYKMSDGRMSGREAEHSGCPVRKGRKWIATQWYREDVSEHWNWQDANEVLRS